MLIRLLLVSVALGLLMAARQFLPGVSAKSPRPASLEDEHSRPSKIVREISSIVEAQEKAWNEGNLNLFLDSYLRSSEVTYISNGTVQKGYQAISDRYKQRYGTDKSSMGQLSLTDLEITEMGAKHALCIGKFSVVKPSQEPINGRFTLIFVRTEGGWKILYDHSSQ